MLFLDTPATSEPVAPKTYPIAWFYNLSVKAHDPNAEGSILLEILPMSADRELYWKDGVITVKTDELFRAMAEVPELAEVFEAIQKAVKPLQAWIKTQEEKDAETPE